MSFEACIQNSNISEQQKSETKLLFRQLEDHYNKQMGASAARSKAASETILRLKKASLENKRRVLKQVQAQAKIKMNIEKYIDGDQNNLKSAALAFVSFDERARSKGHNYLNVEQLQKVIEGAAHSRMDNILASFRRNLWGSTRNKAGQLDMLNEAFGKDTGKSSAKELVQSWYSTTEYLRQRANAAGANIGRIVGEEVRPEGAIGPGQLKDIWGLPVRHNPIPIREVEFEEYSEFLLDVIDVNKMTDRKTGLPFKALSKTDSEGRVDLELSPNLNNALFEMYKSITLEGTNKQNAGAFRGPGSVGNKYGHHRFLIFKDGESWLKYHKRFGDGEPFDIMMGHITNLSRDIALMEIFGPNPNAGVRYLEDVIKKNTAELKVGKSAKIQKQIEQEERSAIFHLNTIYDWVSDRTQAPVHEKFAYYSQGIRNNIHSAFLGSTSVLAFYTDMNFQRIARSFAGLQQTKILNDYLKLLSPLKSKERTQLAIRLNLIAETWNQQAAGQARYVGEVNGPEISRRISTAVMNVSLLSPWTQAGRLAFGMEFLGTLADNVGKRFDELEPKLKNMLQSYQIGEGRWDIIRSTDLMEEKGATFVAARNIEERTDIDRNLARDVATNLMRMVQSETEFAVPSANIKGKAALESNTRPGTIQGEFVKSFAMYKIFGATLMTTHMARGWYKNSLSGRAGYLGSLLISSTLMAALAIQTKEMSKGRDPLPMFGGDPKQLAKFWGAAILASGGLSIYADFIFSRDATGRSSLSETVAGPMIGFGGDFLNLTAVNALEAAQGKDTRIASEAIKFVQRYMPGASMWYWRTALERNLFDQLRLWADPKTNKDFRRLRRKRDRDFNQNYWWDLGESAPTRAPDFSKIFGN
tara:strand:- start:77 stop:2686 length:2610 start_codon:yes stop_codon:yes gene_type:complete